MPLRALVLLLALVVAAPARAATAAPTLALDLRWSPAAQRLTGTATWHLANPTDAPLAALPLWLYANRFAEVPAWISGLTWFRVYPGGFDAGGTRLVRAEVDGVPVALPPDDHAVRVDVPLPTPLAPGTTTVVTLAFETRVPARFGPFGFVEDALTLEGGFYPTPVHLAPEGPREDLVPAAAATVTLVSDTDGEALLGGVHRRTRAGHPTTAVALPPREALSLAWRPRAARLRADGSGAALDFVHAPTRHGVRTGERVPGALDPLTGMPAWPHLVDRGWLDTEGEVVATAADALRFLRQHAPALVPARVRLVEAPLRRELALPGAGVVWVSDRCLRVLPVERLRKFHRVALVRAIYVDAARSFLGAREAPADRDWTADLVAETLLRRWVAARYESYEDAFDVLGPAAFLEIVDNVLYAPQMPFQTDYFHVIDDTDPVRDRYRLAFGTLPAGRRVYEKLRDHLGEDGLADLVTRYLAGDARLADLPGAPAAAVLAPWLGPYPAGNVRLGGVATRRGEGGEPRFCHAAALVREGEAPPEEPVTVRFVLDDGRTQDVVWRGGRSGEATLCDDAALDTVVVDPEGRLVQWLPGAADDLRLDDREGADVKVLLGKVYLSLTPTSDSLSAMAEIIVQRRFDLHHRFGLLPFVVPDKIGGSLFYIYGFGPRITANRLGAFVLANLRAAGVRAGDDESGWRPGVTAELSVGYTDLVTPFDTMRQNEILGTVRYLLSPDGDALLHGGQVDLEGTLVRSVHPRHRFGVRFELGTTLGDLAANERFAVGGLLGVRALGPSEQRGRHAATIGLEYRHTWTRSFDVSVAHLAWWEGLEGVLFADAGASADTFAGFADRDAFVLGVGYGLRFHAALLGIQPSMLSLDFAYLVPTTPALRERGGPPVAAHVYFVQNF